MKDFGRVLLLMLGLGLFAAILLSPPSHPAAAAADPPSIPVTVTNTPLPVKGSVSAAVTGTVGAQQSGVWNVGINGTPSVNANITNGSLPISGSVTLTGNTAATPIFTEDVDEPGRHPWASFCGGGTGSVTTVSCTMSVPAGETVVIQTESFQDIDNGAVNKVFQQQLSTTCSSCGGANPVMILSMPDNGYGLPGSTESFTTVNNTLYASPGTNTITCTLIVPTSTGLTQSCYLTGYWVATP
jgi:hypothetical protein